MSDENTWRSEYAIETSATPETIWSIFRDVPAWKNWNAGIEQINIDGPFATGTCFVDETRVGDLVILVAHRIEPLGPARTRIVYAVDARGPQAAEIGPAVSADFPEVLASLSKLAEGAR
ncbi:hypothetical protein [Bradyrhizobium sp. CCBAU 11361]|uniref:hypothetical protein n=1 Tax=Bradyrhizobium sp. CCBAU 11361 TaxID=1630812 RepID=UPI002305191C|nr:hypothetical protein [Bradyrhizobium sp. CCBAU 11361]MDA9491579.1 hypothetical protein [Bradyrhizobium sp. CCBAU 11361]